MHGYRYAYHIGYQNEVAVGVRLVGTVLPFEHQPYDQGRAERGECVYLALDSRKPEGVAPRICQCGAHAAAHNKRHLPPSDFSGVVADYEATYQMCHRPEQQQYRSRAQQCRHCVDGQCRRAHRAAEKCYEKACREHEYGVARRMPDFKFGSLEDKLGAIPKTCRRLKCEQIGDRRNCKA